MTHASTIREGAVSAVCLPVHKSLLSLPFGELGGLNFCLMFSHSEKQAWSVHRLGWL